jgi:hypothetical protein
MTTQFSTIYASFQEYSAYWELNNSPRQLQAVYAYKIIYFLNIDYVLLPKKVIVTNNDCI